MVQHFLQSIAHRLVVIVRGFRDAMQDEPREPAYIAIRNGDFAPAPVDTFLESQNGRSSV